MKIFTLVVALTFSLFSISQLQYSRVKIWADGDGLQTLNQIGVGIDHAKIKSNTFAICEISIDEIEIARNAGFQVDILIENVQEYYIKRINLEAEKNAECPDETNNDEYNPIVPSNFALGTYAGYFRYQEYLDILDEMHTLYPSLITEKAPVSDTLTHENRPIYFVKIAPQTDDTQYRPKVLYTALHHAREPGSLSETIFFMWYLLENYGTDPEVTYLLDNVEMFFVPMINPDGYIHNETTNPNGGGMHRKNKNPNIGSSNPGVDLNRNYSYQWNTSGVSSNQNNDTYPGTAPFSEPETMNIKKIAESWDIQFAMNAHTYSGMMLYPYGTAVNDYAPDDSYFNKISGLMVKHNAYLNQKSSGLYPTSGDSDDFMYHDHGIFAQTPEIGRIDFWAPSSEILGDCIDMLFSNLIMAHLPLVYGNTKNSNENTYISEEEGVLSYNITRLGRKNGTLTVSIEPILGIQTVGEGHVHNLEIEESENGDITYSLSPDIQFGDEVKYVLITDNGLWQNRDTITKIFGGISAHYFEEGNSLDNWTGDWGITTEDYYSPNSSFTDSPNSNYSNNSTSYFKFNDTIDLTGQTVAMITFMAKWDIESGYDYAQFQVSRDFGDTWIPQCGKYTRYGTGVSPWSGGQPVEPLYDGTKNDWVLEEINLSDYLGEKILVRFMLKSDTYENGDGFYFDDFTVMYDAETGVPSMVESNNLDDFIVYPNPTSKIVNIKFEKQFKGDALMYDGAGRLVKSITNVEPQNKMSFDVSDLEEGIYWIKMIEENKTIKTARVSIVQ